MLIYDIPGRTGAAVATETLVRLAAHPRIIGVKDAKDAPGATSHVLAQTDFVYYCGTDMLNLPWLSLGAVGFISVVGHVVGDRLHEMIDAFGAGDVARARQLHYELIPVYDGLFRNQGAVMTKAALDLLGLPGGAVRAPLLAATEAERHQLALDLTAGGVKLPGSGPAREPPASGPRPARRPAPQRPAHRPARRARRDRPEHDGLRVPRPPAHRGLRRAVPRSRPARRGPDPAGLRLPGRPARPGGGGRPHARPRGPHRRDPVPAQAAPGHPAGRLEADPGPGAEQAGRAPPRSGHRRGGRGQPQFVRPVRLRVPRGQPLDPGRARRGHPHPGRPGAAHRRLQDGPAAAGRQAHRPGRLRPARQPRASTC